MEKYTPGPWLVLPPDKDDNRWWITVPTIAEGGPSTGTFYVAYIVTTAIEGGERRKADAHLIAAAPEMSEALKVYGEFAEHRSDCGPCNNYDLCANGIALLIEAERRRRLATAKAEGRE